MNFRYLANQPHIGRHGDTLLKRTQMRAAPNFTAAARTALLIATQIAALWCVHLSASFAAAAFHIPIPGSVLGLLFLFTLLCSGIVKASWLEPTSSLLVKHFAFFFIPITIGLIGMGPLFVLHGVGILFTLAVSAAVGLAMCGLTSQWLMNAQNARQTRCASDPKA